MTREWEDYFTEEEKKNTMMCFEAAKSAGRAIAQAELCDNGNIGCEDCPWK